MIVRLSDRPVLRSAASALRIYKIEPRDNMRGSVIKDGIGREIEKFAYFDLHLLHNPYDEFIAE